jgi:plastocyanin
MRGRGGVATLTALTGAIVLTAVACGGSSSTPAPTPSPSPAPAPGSTTITISSSGAVSPKELTVAVGSRVTFVNNDARAHDMNSDPHPEHTSCPDINVGNIQPGQSITSQVLAQARTCGFHDHNQPSVVALQGTVRIQ